MQLHRYLFLFTLVGLLTAYCPVVAQDAENECEFEQPSLEQDYWPVISQNPLDTEFNLPPAIDVFIGKDGKPLRFALLGNIYEADKEILFFAAHSLIFKPAYACGEPVDGFYRHMVRSYFFVDPKDRKEISVLPIALFSLPKQVLKPLELISYQTKNRMFNVTFELSKEGQATHIQGQTQVDKVVVKEFLSKLLSNLKFQPAMKDGEPVEVKMHFRIDLGTRYSPAYLNDLKVRKPMPIRPSEGGFSGNKTYSVLLDFYQNGAVSNIQFLTLMNREESLATLNAFRSWKIEDLKGKQGAVPRLKLEFGFVGDSEEAVLIKEEFGSFKRAPRPVKQGPPVYPDHLRRKGIVGTVVLELLVD